MQSSTASQQPNAKKDETVEQASQLSHMACPECDLIQALPPLAIGEVANCVRCNATLFKNQKNSVDRSLAFAITGLILFVIANLFPLLSLRQWA